MNCLNCDNATDNPKFCSRSCAATHNNKKFPKRGDGAGTTCPSCGSFKWYQSELCQNCRYQKNFEEQLERTLADAALEGNARVRWSHVRKVAQRVLEKSGRPKKCAVCGFDAVVDVCHIKPISEFSENALLKEVNSEENLTYLCPNHHALLDRGLLKYGPIV